MSEQTVLPRWVTEELLASPVDPFVGEGAIAEVLEARGHKVHGVELHASAAEAASQHCSLGVNVGDMLEIGTNAFAPNADVGPTIYNVIVTNPPWSIWHDCLACLLAMDLDYLALILPWTSPRQVSAIRNGRYMFTGSKHCLPIIGDDTMSDLAWFVWYNWESVKEGWCARNGRCAVDVDCYDRMPVPYMITIRKAA